MENCLYQRKAICTFDLKDENGLYYEDRVLDLKQAAAERQLFCIECGAHVYLAAGPIKEPYFAHYDLEDCDYGNSHETEELKKGKRLLYHLLKRSFSDSFVQARFRMENGMYSTLYCALEDGRQIAMDYRLQNNSLEKFRLRDNFYQENKIKPIYVMGIRQEKNTKQIDWYQSLLQSSMGYLAFLDTDKERLTLKKSFGYRLGNERRFKYFDKAYPIKELVLDREGSMVCDFTKECNKMDNQIKEEKVCYKKRQEKLKELREENLRQQEIEAQRQEAYRRVKEQEEKELLDINYIAKEMGLNPVLLEKCSKMIKEGNAHLVSKKYYDAIMEN
jgi:competence CoiA-like predicted nuclease